MTNHNGNGEELNGLKISKTPVNLNGIDFYDLSFPADTPEVFTELTRQERYVSPPANLDLTDAYGRSSAGEPPSTQFWLNQWRQMDARIAQQPKPTAIESVRQALSSRWDQSIFKSRKVRWRQFPRGTAYDEMLASAKASSPIDPTESMDIQHLWEQTTTPSDIPLGAGTTEPVSPDHSEKTQPVVDHRNRVRKMGEIICRRRPLVVAIGAVAVAGLLAFGATNLNAHNSSKLVSMTNDQVTTLAPTTKNSLPEKLVVTTSTQPVAAVAKSVENSRPPVVEKSPVAAPPKAVQFVIAKGSNLSWTIKDQLRLMGHNDENVLDRTAALLISQIQADTDRSVEKVFAGDVFEVPLSSVAQSLSATTA